MRHGLWLLTASVLFAVPAAASESACFHNDQSQVSLVSPFKVAPRTMQQKVGVHFKTSPGWHVYWKNSGDAGYAPVIDWSFTPGLQSAELTWPAPQRFKLRGGLEALGYEGEVVYPVTVKLADVGERVRLKADVDYLVCEDECIPYRCMLVLDVPTAEQAVIDDDSAALLAEYEQRVPITWAQAQPVGHREELSQDLTFTLRLTGADGAKPELFFATHADYDIRTIGPLSAKLVPKVDGKRPLPVKLEYTVTGLPSGAAVTHQVTLSAGGKSDTPLLLALLLAWLGGLILNVMPCVLPVLSVKLIGLLEKAHDEGAVIRKAALGTTFGIWLSFAALFGVAQLARSAGQAVGWGMQFQEPRFVAFLLVLVTLFAFNLWGLFELQLPAWLMNRIGGRETGSWGSHIASGLFATALATPCSAPFLGTAVAYALTAPPLLSSVLFFFIGLGLSTPYLVLALQPHAVRILPKPGLWMVQLKQALGYALAATSVWLLYVLSAQVARETVAYVLLCLLAAGLGFQSFAGGRVRRLLFGLLIVAGAAAPVWLAQAPIAAASEGIAWQTFDRQQAEKLAANGRLVFVDITADWCFTCKANEHGVLASPQITELFKRRNVVAMRGDWTNRSSSITEFLQAHERYGIPFYLVYPGKAAPRVLSELLTEAELISALETP